MEEEKQYDISIAIKRDADSPSPYAGQLVEYNGMAYKLFAVNDKYVLMESIIGVDKKYVDELLGILTKDAPFSYKSLVLFREKEDGEDGIFPEYSGTIHGGIIYKERLPFAPPSTAVSCCI
jgi:hypothetical protein